MALGDYQVLDFHPWRITILHWYLGSHFEVIWQPSFAFRSWCTIFVWHVASYKCLQLSSCYLTRSSKWLTSPLESTSSRSARLLLKVIVKMSLSIEVQYLKLATLCWMVFVSNSSPVNSRWSYALWKIVSWGYPAQIKTPKIQLSGHYRAWSCMLRMVACLIVYKFPELPADSGDKCSLTGINFDQDRTPDKIEMLKLPRNRPTRSYILATQNGASSPILSLALPSTLSLFSLPQSLCPDSRNSAKQMTYPMLPRLHTTACRAPQRSRTFWPPDAHNGPRMTRGPWCQCRSWGRTSRGHDF